MKQPERYVEPRLTQYLFDRASRTLTPLSGTFELSPVCNLACKMCYVRKTPAEVAASPRPPVGLIQWLSIAEQARDVGRLADTLRHDAEAAHRAEGQAFPRGLERADARQLGPTSLRHLHRLPEPAHLPLLRRHGHGRDGKRLRHSEISVRNGLGHAHGGRAAAGRATKTNNIAFRPRQEILPGANFVVWTRNIWRSCPPRTVNFQ